MEHVSSGEALLICREVGDKLGRASCRPGGVYDDYMCLFGR